MYSVALTKHAVLGSWCIRLLSVVVMFAVTKLLCLEADDEKLGMVADWQPLGLLCFWQSPPLLLYLPNVSTWGSVVVELATTPLVLGISVVSAVRCSMAITPNSRVYQGHHVFGCGVCNGSLTKHVVLGV